MSKDYEIGMLWVEGPLSYVEVMCAQSFIDAGHHVKIYHYQDVENVPEGAELIHGDEVLKIDRFIQHGRTGSFALFSDVFRYHLLKKNAPMIWADLDAYCVKKFESETGHFFGWESKHHINGGVLGLPPDSDALGQLLEMTEDEYGIPFWFAQEEKDRLQALKDAGTPVHVSEMPWGVWGPHAVTHCLHRTGEDKYALPIEGLYPIGFRERRTLMGAEHKDKVLQQLTDNTYSVHFYGRRVKDWLTYLGGLPEPGSYMDGLLKKHNIDTEAAPVLSKEQRAALQAEKTAPKVEPVARRPIGKGGENLTDLADRYGSEKGSSKHLYTELYHMLFHPFRTRKINFLEMGSLSAGPETEAANEPPIRMWLDYFPKAQIHAMDASDFAGLKHDRFTFHRCDPDNRAEIGEAVDAMPAGLDIVIDGASPASHHQQNAFLEIFPRMQSGGLYVIEGLRWQPKALEKPGITKTATLFRSWLDGREFQHSDPHVAAEFNAISDMISGCIVEPVRYQKRRRDQMVVIHKK